MDFASNCYRRRARAGGLPHRCRRNLHRAPEVPRSYREAQLVLRLMAYGASGASVAFFDELGVFQILAEAQDPNTIHRFVRKWLGALLDYDGNRNTDLVHTLAATSKQVATTPTRPVHSACTATRFATD